MSTSTRQSGISVTTSEGLTVAKPVSSKRRVAGAAQGALGDDFIAAAISEQDLQLVDEVQLNISKTRAKRALQPQPLLAATFDVPIGDDESAVLLVEDEGVYRWIVDGQPFIAPASRKRRGAAAAGAGEQMLRFDIDIDDVSDRAAVVKPSRRKRGGLFDAILGKVRVYVFKFAVRFAGKYVVRFLERNVRQGLVWIGSADPREWRLLADDEVLPKSLPKERAPRILLLVHGTFSSTRGSYGALGGTPWGQDFLGQAFNAYDAVLGFDHSTLSVDPQVNAVDMLARLQKIAWPHPPTIDIIAFSRGGLVTRSFIEQLLPSARWPVTVRRVVFVACTNGGTLLAEPGNWHQFADLYTNFALWGTRALGLIPGAQGVAEVAREAIQGVGVLVKVLATHAVDEQGIPGLAAMQPNGEFITTLNLFQPGQPTPSESFYCAVLSNFEPGLALQDDSVPELPPKLLIRLADRVSDPLIGEDNDLVVHTRSMTEIDPNSGEYVKDRLDFGTNGFVYHTNYFTRKGTVEALARWLGLDIVAAAVAAPRQRRRLPAAAKSAAVPPVIAQAPIVNPGATVAGTATAAARTNILEVKAGENTKEVISRMEAHRPDYVVVEREHYGMQMFYAFSPDEVRAAGSGKGLQKSLKESLDLHEGDASPTTPDQALPAVASKPDPERPAIARNVMLSGGRPAGVIPSPSDLPERERQTMAASEPVERAASVKKAAARKKAPGVKRGGSRRGPQAAGSVARMQETAPTQAECYFRAEMDEEVVANDVSSVEVTISREMLAAAARGTSATQKKKVAVAKKLIVHIAARRNFRIEGESRVEIKVPAPGKPAQLFFDVTGVNPGEEGELWVQVRQGPSPLVTLKLFPQVVASRTQAPRRARAAANLTSLPPAEKVLDQILIVESLIGDQVSYDYYVDMPSIKFRKPFKSDPLPGARDDYIRQILNEIGDRWAGDGKKGLAAFERDLRAIGGKLFDQLIPRDMQSLLWENRDRIRAIQIISMEPFIPWEMVYIKKPGQRTLPADSKFLGELGAVRWLYEGHPPKNIQIRKGYTRYLIPDYPRSLELPNAQEEAGMVRKLFKAREVSPVLYDVQNLLMQPGQFDLLHFAGHGEAAGTQSVDARLLLQGDLDGNGNFVGDALSANTVEQIASFSEEAGPIVVLNACESARRNREFAGMGGFADAFVKAHASIFVGTHWSVGDEQSLTFIEAFYRSLTSGGKRPVRLVDAVSAARKAARDAGDATWLAYVVYGHPEAVVQMN